MKTNVSYSCRKSLLCVENC